MLVTAPPQPFDTGWPSGAYLPPANANTFASGAISTSAIESFLPFILPHAINIVRIGLYLVTAQSGAEARLGLYADSNGLPGALILDAGTLDLSSGGGAIKEITVNLTVSGKIWSCCQIKNVATQATVIRMGLPSGPLLPLNSTVWAAATPPRYYQRTAALTYGSALLDPASAVTGVAGSDAPVIGLKSA